MLSPPFEYDITVYDSAGERVRALASAVPSFTSPADFKILQALVLQASGQDAVIRAGGKTYLFDGNGDAGQPLAGGTYEVELRETDPWGHVQTWAGQVQVLASAAPPSLVVSNAAGEEVRALDWGSPASAGVGGVVTADSRVLLPGQGRALRFQAGAAWAQWDGRGGSGAYVAPGVYSVTLQRQSPGGGAVSAVQVEVLAAPAGGLSLAFSADPWNPARGALEIFCGPGQALARVYSLDGGLRARASSADGIVRLQGGGLAPGIYVVVVEVSDGRGGFSRRSAKLAVLR